MFQAEDDLLLRESTFANNPRGVEQHEAPHQAQYQMPIVGVFTLYLTGTGCQQVLQDPETVLDPVAPSPPADQLWSTPLGLQTHQVETVLAWLIDDNHRYLIIGRTGGAKPHVPYPCLPRILMPVPPTALDQVVAFDLSPIGQGETIGCFALYQQGALCVVATWS
jgi:hypothetical protein